MMTLPWLKMLPWGIAALMAIAAATCLHLYQSERDAFVAYRAEVTAIGKAQEAQIKKEKEQAEANLQQVRKDYEDRVPDIRRDAVAAYRMRNPQSRSCPMPGGGTSQPVDDGAKQELVSVDADFIQECATDTAKLGAFQDYCKRNNCPIKE